MLNDLRFAIRMLIKNPVFSAVVVLTLGIAIGANTAIFTVADWVLLRALPFKNPDQLVVWQEYPKRGWSPNVQFSFPNFVDVKSLNRSFQSISAVMFGGFNLNADREPERLGGAFISADTFATFGTQPLHGRFFFPDEEKAGAARVAIISETLWKRRFNSDPALIGKPITINGEPHTVVGIVPFAGPFPNYDLFVPLALDYAQAGRGNRSLVTFARLKDGVTLEGAKTDLAAIAQRLVPVDRVSNSDLEMSVVPVHEQMVKNIRRVLLLVMSAVAFVLLIACTNVAGLLLARAEARHREMAIRASLGASRGRLIRQMLTESLLLALLGGGLGMLLANWAVNAFVASQPVGIPRLRAMTCDSHALIFSAAISILSGIAFGIFPALQRTSDSRLSDALKAGGKASGVGRSRQTARSALVVAQMALTLILLVGAGLMIRSLREMLAVNPGFETDHVLSMEMVLPANSYGNPEKKIHFVSEIVRRSGAVPGIRSAGVTTALPFSGDNASTGVAIEGLNFSPTDYPHANWRAVTPDYLATLGVPLLHGRPLAESDAQNSPRVMLVNDVMAQRFWPNEDPIGKRVIPDAMNYGKDRWVTIVGVVKSIHHLSLAGDPVPEMYIPYSQIPVECVTLAMRTSVPPLSLAEAVKHEIAAVDPTLPVFGVNTLENLVAGSTSWSRAIPLLLGLFAGTALVLATLGIYGVIAFSVSQRTREIGIRMALGAQRRDVLRLVTRQGTLLVCAGIVIGLGGALALTRLMNNLLFGVRPTDPATYFAVALLLGVVAIAACLVPARRAMRIDPMVALRSE